MIKNSNVIGNVDRYYYFARIEPFIMQSEELATDSNNPTVWIKMQSIAVTVVAIMLSLGQWNDTKDAIETVYESVVTNFTHQVEYEQLSQLKVGQTYEYVQSFMGVPVASKPSRLQPVIHYYYYGTDKYLLSVIVEGERVSGYSITALTDDFAMAIPYTDMVLTESPLSEYSPEYENYLTDFGNINYYAEVNTLGRSALFYNLLLATVDYGEMLPGVKEKIQSLNYQLNLGEDVMENDMEIIRQSQPNMFALSETSPEIMIESMLTRYEFVAFFK